MAEPARIVERIRAQGANVVVDGDTLRIINRDKLTADAIAFIRANGKAIASFLEGESIEVDERAAIIEFDGKTPREWADQFANVLIRLRPRGISDADWAWFITSCGRIIDETPAPEGATW